MTKSDRDFKRVRGSWMVAGIVAVLVSIPLAAFLLAVSAALGDRLGGLAEGFPAPVVFLWGMAAGLPENAPSAFAIGAAAGALTRRKLESGGSALHFRRNLASVCGLAGSIYGALLGLLQLYSGGAFPWVFLPVGAIVGGSISLVAVAVVTSDYRHDQERNLVR